MKKMFLFFCVSLLAVASAWAERIDEATAREVARGLFSRIDKAPGTRSAEPLTRVRSVRPVSKSLSMDGQGENYYIYNRDHERGFVIVAGDDHVRPILGYALEGSFDPENMPASLNDWLATCEEQIAWAIERGLESTPALRDEWDFFLGDEDPESIGTKAATVQGVLLDTPNWGQRAPYNEDTPLIDGEHTPTGCVATAMGIIMRYYGYPSRVVEAPDENMYWVDGVKTVKHLDYTAGYDWSDMRFDYEKGTYTAADAEEMARLLYHCGANVEMAYDTEASGANKAYAVRALTEVFGYSPSIRLLSREAYTWEKWKAMIKKSLDDGTPLLYGARQPGGSGHAFVCDGYDTNDLFHINWGWHGLYNGYFALSLLDYRDEGNGFTERHQAIFDIIPTEEGERYVAVPYVSRADYKCSGDTVSVRFDIKYNPIYPDIFFMELGVVNDRDSVTRAPETMSPMIVPVHLGDLYESEGERYYRYITLDTPLADDERVTLLSSTDGEHWTLMRTMSAVSQGVRGMGTITTTIEPLASADPEIWGGEGRLHVKAPREGVVRVTTFGGRLVGTYRVDAGPNVIDLPRGAYIISLENKSRKIRL